MNPGNIKQGASTEHMLEGAKSIEQEYSDTVEWRAADLAVGDKVSLKIPGLHGQHTVYGFVRSLTAKGVEVKTQQHGYFVVPMRDLTVIAK